MRKIIFLWLGMLGVCAQADLIGELRQSAIEARQEAVGVTFREPSSTFAFGPFASLYSDGASGAGFGLELSTQLRDEDALYLGFHLAYSAMPYLAAGSVTGFHFLPTLTYYFGKSSARSMVQFYVGLAAGAAFLQGAGSPGAYFEFLFRPGLRLGDFDSAFLNLEPKLGVLASRVVFMPQLSVAIPF